jgi:hypothetical protein
MAQCTQDEIDDVHRRIENLLDEVRTASSIVDAQHKSGVVIGYAKALGDLGVLPWDKCKDVLRDAMLAEQQWQPPKIP